MPHVRMVSFKSAQLKEKLVSCGDLLVKNRRYVVIDPEPKEVKVKLLWIPERLEDAMIYEALQEYGKVTSIAKENWKVAHVE